VIVGVFLFMTDYSTIPDCFYRISIKALVLDEQGKFLLCREDDNRWDFPGGGYDHTDISPRDALIRELREEMGVEMLTIEECPSYLVTAKHRK
jgi:ADP-ribose pyrophosphatase YjhB (NUDIX family)